VSTKKKKWGGGGGRKKKNVAVSNSEPSLNKCIVVMNIQGKLA
jgi:hypothetical protein